MTLAKYYVTVTGWKGVIKSPIYISKKFFTDKKKAILDFATQQVKCIELNFPFTEYDEVWIYLHYQNKVMNEILCSSMFDINALKADYKKEGGVI